ncbi:HD domain-containing protein [Sediminibacillus dalangtanensis]|uniref:HD domain-containing protein n=1 Tax=Sediminibacillus dalangtanensis TaxID=2729421 RepID=A0ABX7VRQ1_9BACI|nr:HD domain-containing protein [Sediminibacillus dalangtanensis]QTM99604.1 HD domain-containing protein [Sediminibacillus dalangtanensis]
MNPVHLRQIEAYVYRKFCEEGTGHDYSHMKRVASMACMLADREKADKQISEAAGWLHDITDDKLVDDPAAAKLELVQFMKDIGIKEEERSAIDNAIADVSYRYGHNQPKTLEGQIVQDADRLDAIGAIGIARAFAFGGAHGRLIYEEGNDQTTIQHFYDKLLLLKDLMNTDSAAMIAEERHEIMKGFLRQFHLEWEVMGESSANPL